MRNLMALLMSCDPADLARIARWWSVDLPRAGKGEQAAALSREMLRDSSAHRFWERLDGQAGALFMRFAEEPERRLSALGLGRDDPSLRTCMEAGAVWAFEESERAGSLPSLTLPPVPDPTLVLPPELCRLANRLRADIEAGDTSEMPLHESLQKLGTGELENLAAYWGLAAEPGSYTRDELLEALLGRISGAPTDRVVKEAQEPARRLYEGLLRRGGRARTAELGEELGLDGPELRDAVADLGERLLALEAYCGDGWLLYAPAGPQHSLPGEEAGRAPEPVRAPERNAHAPAWAPAWDLINLLRALELYDVPADGDAELPEAFASRFDSALTTRPSDPGANLRFLYSAARALGLVEVRDGSIKAAPGARRWAETGLESQARRLLEVWCEHGAPDETTPLAGAAGYRHDRETLRTARGVLLEHLSQCEPGVWYGVAPLIGLVRARSPFLLRPQNRLVRDLGSAGARDAMQSWPEVEGAWLRALLTGPLSWLHVIEVAESAGEDEGVLSLTPDGAWLAGRVGRPPVSTSPPRLAVTPEGRIRVSAPDGRLLWALAGFARPTRSGNLPGYLIDRRSVARARGAGVGAASVVALLRKHSESGVPPKLVGLIQEWGREPHRIRMRAALLVECETEAGAEELMASPIVRSHSPRRIDPTGVLLALPRENVDEELQTLMRRLTRSGLFSADRPKPHPS
jgi:hypothetical protein